MSKDLQHRAAQFLYHEARLLDERRFEEWLALFSEEAIYWIPATPGQSDPVGEASIAYERRHLLEVRVRRLRHPENYADQPPARTRRVIGNVTVTEDTDHDGIEVRSGFVMVEFQDDRQRLFAGEYTHLLRPRGHGFEIDRKRVDLLNCDAPMGPVVIPF